jgi:7,8-dihydroneopterin aldolase/epimerase/oxygenase
MTRPNHYATIVRVEALEVDATIGVFPEEKGRTQRILVDVDIDLGLMVANGEDNLRETFDYFRLCRLIREAAVERHYQLVETLAQHIINWCMTDGRVERVRCRIIKLEAMPDARGVGCILERVR